MRKTLNMLLFLLALGLAAPVLAAENLMDELPDGHDTFIAVDFLQMRDSPLYDQGFAALMNHQMFAEMVNRLQNDLGIDARNDLEALVVVSDAPPLSPSMLNQPMGSMQGAAGQGSDGALVIVRGDIDSEELLARLGDEDEEEGSVTQLRLDEMDLEIIDEQTVAISLGSTDYRDKIRTRLSEDRSGPGAIFKDGLTSLRPTQGVHLMIKPTLEGDAASELEDELGGTPLFTAVALEMKDEVRLGILMTLDGEDAATKMVTDVDELRKEARSNPLATMFGVRPLIDNLSVRQDGQDILIRSSMTNNEALRFATQVLSLAASSQQLSRPLGGSSEDSEESESDDSDAPAPSPNGVDADFN